MGKRSIALVALASLPLFAGCAAPPPAAPKVDVAAAEAEVRAVEAAWLADWKAKDVAKLLARYTPDAILATPGAPVARGADALKQVYPLVLADPGFSLNFAPDTVDVASSGDMAVTSGHYEQTSTDPKTKKVAQTHGAYVVAYKKGADGVWRAFQDIITPSAAAPPAK